MHKGNKTLNIFKSSAEGTFLIHKNVILINNSILCNFEWVYKFECVAIALYCISAGSPL